MLLPAGKFSSLLSSTPNSFILAFPASALGLPARAGHHSLQSGYPSPLSQEASVRRSTSHLQLSLVGKSGPSILLVTGKDEVVTRKRGHF